MSTTTPRRWRLLICTNYRPSAAKPSCRARGGDKLLEPIATALQNQGLGVTIERINCLGQCEHGPTMRLAPGGDFFLGMTAEKIPAMLDAVRKAVDGTQDGDERKQTDQTAPDTA